MRLVDILEDEKGYKDYFYRRRIKGFMLVFFFIMGTIIARVCNVLFLIKYFFIPFLVEFLGGIMGIFIVVYVIRKSAHQVYTYYADSGSERFIVFSQEGYTEIIDDVEEMIPWDKVISLEEEKAYYVLAINQRPYILLNKNKIPEDIQKILKDVIKTYQGFWNGENGPITGTEVQEEEKICLENSQSCYYVEITEERFLRKNKLSNYMNISKKIWIIMGIVTFPVWGGVLISPLLLIGVICFIGFIKWSIRHSILKVYHKTSNRLSYYVWFNEEEVSYKDYYREGHVSWKYIKRMHETKKDFYIYLSDTEVIMLPKEILREDDIAYLHSKCKKI